MCKINDAEIKKMESILLPPNCSFSDERRFFIKSMDSLDVLACPGSGKTTALLAKVLILACRYPFCDGRGICVLTHTNVAIEELEKRTGGSARYLLRYPNYFGTIQGFVDRFFAIPFYRIKYNKQVQVIDNNYFSSKIEKYYNSKLYKDIHPWLEPRGGVAKLAKYWLKSENLSIGEDLDNDIKNLSRGTATYKKIESIRHKMLEDGVLNFNDAYSLGLHYIKIYPAIVSAVRNRFKFVFIDEMQDCAPHQVKILDQLFCCDSVILQRLGDPNQAIYQSETAIDSNIVWVPAMNRCSFSDSLRYGQTIAKVLDTVRVDRQIPLCSKAKHESLSPHLLVFGKGEESKVLPIFASIICEKKLNEIRTASFKAVGWVGKDKREEGKVCLPSYYPDYREKHRGNAHNYSNLLSYIHAMHEARSGFPKDAGVLAKLLFEASAHTLRIAGLKLPETDRFFSTFTLKEYLIKNNKINEVVRMFSEWIADFVNERIASVDLRNSVAAFLREQFDLEKYNHLISSFLDSDETYSSIPKADEENIFISSEGIRIGVGTVHSVKGETHTATLYLETYKHDLESARLLPFCKGIYPVKKSEMSRNRENLRIAHVGFSRPTHLLAFACRNDHVAGNEKELENNGWVLRFL